MAAPYTRRPGESAKQFEAARIYFELGPERSLTKAADKVKKKVANLKAWSAKWDWAERAKRFDRIRNAERQAEIARLLKEDARKWADLDAKLRERLYDTGKRALDHYDSMLKFPLAEVIQEGEECMTPEGKLVKRITVIHPSKWTLLTAARFALTGAKLGMEATRWRDQEGKGGGKVEERFGIVDWTPDEEEKESNE